MIMESISPDMFERALYMLPECAAILDGGGRIWWLNHAGADSLPAVGSFCFAELPQVKECLKTGTGAKNIRVSFTARGNHTSGLLSVSPISQEGSVVCILALFRPDFGEAAPRGRLPDELPFKSEAMHAVRDRLAKLAIINSTVLFTGERGTGKATFARLLHINGARASEPFMIIDCKDADEHALSAELLGVQDSPGKAELAGSGALFIKNVEYLPHVLQTKLFDILRTKRVTYLDDSRSAAIEARILLSASSDLKIAVNAGKFREDLFTRISVMTINIPPLRERVEDIPPLAWYFSQKYADIVKKEITGFTAGAVEQLCSHMWPENIQQLEDVICAAVELCDGKLITNECIPKEVKVLPSLNKMTAGFERERVLSLLKLYGNSVEGKRKAAAELNIGLSTLYRILGRR